MWAEAYYLWQQGESLYLDKDMEAEAVKAQSAHTEESEKVGLVREYLDTLLPENWDSLDLYERRDFWKVMSLLSQVQCSGIRFVFLRYGAKCLKETQRTLIV